MERTGIAVTGGAGFIRTHLVDSLVQDHEVIVIDNLSTGFREFVNNKAQFHELDLVKDDISPVLEGVDAVFHLVANADVIIGVHNPHVHLEQNVFAT